MPRGTGNTREEIVAVAMRLFVDQGYDKTSLREIAEELDVTKAALYYHFRTKEDIVHAALEAHVARLDAVLGWLAATAPGDTRDREFVNRLEAMFAGDSGLAMRFGQVNPTVLGREGFAEVHIAQLHRLVESLAGPRAGAEQQIRATLAFGALIIGSLGGGMEAAVQFSGTPAQRRKAARRVALDLLGAIRPR